MTTKLLDSIIMLLFCKTQAVIEEFYGAKNNKSLGCWPWNEE